MHEKEILFGGGSVVAGVLDTLLIMFIPTKQKEQTLPAIDRIKETVSISISCLRLPGGLFDS